MRLLIDAHLDIAWNALSFNREQTLEVSELRASEAGMTDQKSRGNNTVSVPELRRAGVAVCVATLLARSGIGHDPKKNLHRYDLEFSSQQIAYATANGQLAYYRLLEQSGQVRIIETRRDLERHLQDWQDADLAAPHALPIGLILSMEGADPVVAPGQIEHWYEAGLRAIGPAHYGQSHYAGGTGCDTPMTTAGVELLAEMQRVGMALDVTHLCDEAMAQAFDLFGGVFWASHHNCRALVDHVRQLTDRQIQQLIERDAVIGAALDAWMLYPGWIRHESEPGLVKMESVVDHIDHVCQLAGNTGHSAIGTDLDGGFGTEQTPGDLNTIADVQRIAEMLDRRGYSNEDIDAIFHGNWLRIFRRALPE
ncbi:MAG: membrane dipeptidase [Pirellulales bacterium]